MSAETPQPVNPNALRIDEAARLLTTVGGQPMSEEMLTGDIHDGAPLNADGTLNLVHYAAWLVREISGRNDGHWPLQAQIDIEALSNDDPPVAILGAIPMPWNVFGLDLISRGERCGQERNY